MALEAIMFNAADNTAVALMDLPNGRRIALKADGQERNVTLIEPITYQHKFSVAPIKKGERVLKYGQVIGEATTDIKAGEHVHIHNMVGLRIKAASKA
ncbi:MAG: D-galactarate dehydratase [Dehalococcoidia bacterium]|nr:MAG: D-galactarate dehydratase [Dehalococcoidia bacterium]